MKRKLILCLGMLVLHPNLLFPQQNTIIDSVSFQAQRPTAGKKSVYTLRFSLKEPLVSDASLRIEFPAEFDLSGVLLAGSNTINGGIDTRVEGQTLYLTRTGKGSVFPKEEIYEVSFANVKNPGAGNYAINVSLDNDSSDRDYVFSKQGNVSILPEEE